MPPLDIAKSISFGLERTGQVLFRPFSFRKWAAIAVAGMLMLVGEGGFNGGVGNLGSSGGGGGGRGGGGGGPTFDDVLQWINTHLVLVITLVVLVSVVGFALYMVARWLSSRGHFMLYDAVVKNSDAIQQPWRQYRRLGNSLFKFRLLYDLVIFNLFLLIVLLAGGLAWPDIHAALIAGEYTFRGWTMSAIIVLVVFLPLAGLAALFASGLVFGLAVPLMYVRDMPAWPAVKTAWREMVRPHPGPCILYLLFRIVIAMTTHFWQAMGSFLLMAVTCCMALFVMLIPIVGNYPLALVSLPVFVFERAYALHFVSQFWPEYPLRWEFGGATGFPVQLHTPGTSAPADAAPPLPPPSPQDPQ